MSSAVPPGTCVTHGWHGMTTCPGCSSFAGPFTPLETPSPPMLVKVGVYCLRGGGHWACYDQEDAMACGSKGPDVYIAIDIEDIAYYPPWLRMVAVAHLKEIRYVPPEVSA